MMKRVARQVVGWFFIAFGIVGLFLPILQGVLFLLVGMIILAPDVPLFRRILARLEERYPVPFAKAKGIHVDLAGKLRKMLAGFTRCGRTRVRNRRTGTGE